MPRHVALILDGNRRFALKAGLAHVSEGHRQGAKKAREVIRWCDELDIPFVTLWGLSTDNLNRPSSELEGIFRVISEGLEALLQQMPRNSRRRRVRAVGRLDLLPEDLQQRIRQVEEATSTWGPGMVNLVLAYGGRDEILDAVRMLLLAKASEGVSIRQVADNVCAEDLRKHLYAPDLPEPELVIRTSGEVRLGGFLLWQTVYSELYFCDALWPNFRKIDFLRAVRSFQQRKRRFGR